MEYLSHLLKREDRKSQWTRNSITNARISVQEYVQQVFPSITNSRAPVADEFLCEVLKFHSEELNLGECFRKQLCRITFKQFCVILVTDKSTTKVSKPKLSTSNIMYKFSQMVPSPWFHYSDCLLSSDKSGANYKISNFFKENLTESTSLILFCFETTERLP